MGSITCDGDVVEFDDRVIAHLQVVLVLRFRAGEPVLLSWLDPAAESGRSAMWLTPSAVVHFKFWGSRTPAIDAEWVRGLAAAAASGPGLIVVNETGQLIAAGAHHTTRGR